MTTPDWLRSDGHAAASVTLTLHIQPGAKKSEIAGLHGPALKIRLAAPPVDGKANDSLIAFLADKLDIPRSHIELVGGAASRSKRVRIDGVPAATIERRLLPATATAAK